MRDRFRDPRGWLLDSLPWAIRKRVMARQMKCPASEIPDAARYIAMRRPPWYVIEWGRHLAQEHGWQDSEFPSRPEKS